MPDKIFQFEGNNLTLLDPNGIQFDNPFVEAVYRASFAAVAAPHYAPQLDVDVTFVGNGPIDIVALANQHQEEVPPPSAKANNPARARIQNHVRHFLGKYPEFLGLLRNTVTTADIAIRNAEFLLGAPVTDANFVSAKALIDRVDRQLWSRPKDSSERQSGVGVLGEISESLLAKALAGLIDDENFFRVNGNQVKSYGDFVVMCLPNNLWVSVKSNYARERLLASGYSNDIVGAGFFVDPDEFTNPVRIRNFQRVGFLAMYCPDVAVTDAQRILGTSTYQQIQNIYAQRHQPVPLNINGKPFIRQLSTLPADLGALVAINSPKRRLTVTF
jgi:hypothetical protein